MLSCSWLLAHSEPFSLQLFSTWHEEAFELPSFTQETELENCLFKTTGLTLYECGKMLDRNKAVYFLEWNATFIYFFPHSSNHAINQWMCYFHKWPVIILLSVQHQFSTRHIFFVYHRHTSVNKYLSSSRSFSSNLSRQYCWSKVPEIV